MSIDFWRTAGIAMAAIGQTAFVLLYLTFPWWEKFLGRALFFKAVTFALLVDIAVLGRVLDWDFEDVTFVVLYWITALGIWAQFVAFLRVRLQHRQDAVSRNGGGR